MRFAREWAMPSKHTFTILPIKELVERRIRGLARIADPFSGFNSPAHFTNDLNPNAPTMAHEDARDFAKRFADQDLDGLLFDPPYSPRQISECYKGIGLTVGMKETQSALLYSQVKDAFAPKLQVGAIVISCGWSSVGFGIGRGFRQVELLMVCHGGAHNDTIVVVEEKTHHIHPEPEMHP